MRWIFTLLLSMPLFGGAQQLAVHPPVLEDGGPFFVEAFGLFPTPCSLDADRVESSFDGSTLTINLVPPAAGFTCIQVLTDLRRAFGAFRIAEIPAEGLGLVLQSGGDEVARTVVLPDAQPATVLRTDGGVYWDPSYAGTGFGVEAQGDDVFLTGFSYDEIGTDTWLVAQGRRDGAVIETDALRFSGGACLLCGHPALQGTGTAVGELQLVFTGSHELLLGVGEEPGRALTLIPLSLNTVQSEGTIAGVSFTLPDLSGRWSFSSPEGGFQRVATMESVFSGIADSGMAVFASTDDSVRLECGMTGDRERFRCALRLDGAVVGEANSSDLSHAAIRSDSLLGVRLD